MERTISNIKSKVLFLLLALSQGTWATDYITDVTIAAGKASRDSKVKEGWTALSTSTAAPSLLTAATVVQASVAETMADSPGMFASMVAASMQRGVKMATA